MTKVSISFAGAAGLAGFPDFPLTLAQQLQAEFPQAYICLIQDPGRRLAELVDTEVLCAVRFSKKDFEAATRLKWLHLTSAGSTHVLFPELVESDVMVTNSRGLYGIPIAEHVLGMMLMFLHAAYTRRTVSRGKASGRVRRYSASSR